MKSSRDGVFCYACNLNYRPDYMLHHLRFDHSHTEVAYHLSLVYVDDWKEERQIAKEEAERAKVKPQNA